MSYVSWRSLPAMFFDQAANRANRSFLWAKKEGVYRPLTWGETAEQVDLLARALTALGIGREDRVALISENRPEWLIADIAIMSAGAITVPAFTTNTVADHRHILTHSGAKAAILSSRQIARRLLPATLEAPDLKFLISLEPLELTQSHQFRVLSWEEALELGRQAPDTIDETVAGLKRDEVSCFIYTSGTGGTPKGVMLTHGSIMANCEGAYDLLHSFHLGEEVFLSFLPLSHSYEHTAGQFLPIALGAELYYAEGVETLAANMQEVRPTIMTAVPRLYETMHQRLLRGVDKMSGVQKWLFLKAVELGRRNYEQPGSLGPWERLIDWVCERTVRKKVRARFGGRLKAMVSGGAALNYEVGVFFIALGVPLLQGYGQTEASPVISANPPQRIKLRTVGPPLKDVEVKIAEDGEILVRGECVMKGYWRDPESTAKTIIDGWLHTGDIGLVDEEGYIQITDRKKDIIVFSGGDNVSPARVEGFLTLQPEISQAMVYGDKRPNLVAILVPDAEFLTAWAKSRDKPDDLARLAEDPDLIKALSPVVDRVNRDLSSLEKVRRFVIAREPFTIDNGMLTASLKIRRHKIRETYGQALETLYERA
ncbi:MAG TPA: long-chain fatty acid--CoA ligase [Alphaproteobacteria bacterium]|nr:long-chain fatty acid--CoA ligase [Alphaproteobacteria bacterium]